MKVNSNYDLMKKIVPALSLVILFFSKCQEAPENFQKEEVAQSQPSNNVGYNSGVQSTLSDSAVYYKFVYKNSEYRIGIDGKTVVLAVTKAGPNSGVKEGMVALYDNILRPQPPPPCQCPCVCPTPWPVMILKFEDDHIFFSDANGQQQFNAVLVDQFQLTPQGEVPSVPVM
jgi:hypothetical protein